MTEMIDIPAAKEYVLTNYPNDPLLRTIAVTLLDKLPKVRVLPYEGVEMIRIRYAAAKGAEKSILGEVLGLFEAAPEPKGCAYCRFEMDLETDGGGELDLARMIPLPAINLTTGENEKTAPLHIWL